MKTIKAWHFVSDDRKLGYGDGRKVRKGITHKVKVEPILCQQGLHASIRAIDAIQYAPGNVVSRIIIGGEIIKGDDKIVGTERTYLWVADAEDTLREFARWCALEVIGLWDAPDIVVEYLRTGDESIRVAAWDARDAWDARAAWAARAAFMEKANRKLTNMLNKLKPK